MMTKAITKISRSEKETQTIAQKVAKCLRPGNIVCLFGDLGAGKTTFVKGLAKGLRLNSEDVHSPSYVLMNIYPGKKMNLFHFDLYRLDHLDEIYAIGFEEFLYGDDLSVIEWAERLKEEMPLEYLAVNLSHQGEDKRKIQIKTIGKKYIQIFEKLNDEITSH